MASPLVVQRAQAIKAATKEVRRLHAQRQVADAKAMRNGPNTMPTLDLLLNSNVRIWHEKGGWTGPFKLLSIHGETCVIDMPHGPTNFRSTVVKPYYTENAREEQQRAGQTKRSTNLTVKLINQLLELTKLYAMAVDDHQVRRISLSQHSISLKTSVLTSRTSTIWMTSSLPLLLRKSKFLSFMTNKEQADKELSLKLKRKA
jgi:hypothetical protein